ISTVSNGIVPTIQSPVGRVESLQASTFSGARRFPVQDVGLPGSSSAHNRYEHCRQSQAGEGHLGGGAHAGGHGRSVDAFHLGHVDVRLGLRGSVGHRAVVLDDGADTAGGDHHGGAPVFDGTQLGDGQLLVGLAGEVVVSVVGGDHDDLSALGHGITDRFVEGNVETDTDRQGGAVHVHCPRFGAGQGVGADLLQTFHELGEEVSVGDVFTEGNEVALVVVLTGSGVGVPHHALHVTGPVVVEATQPPQQRNPDVLGGPGDDLLGSLVAERVDVAGVLGKQHHVGPRLLPGAYGLGEFVDTVGVIVENLHAFAEDRHFPDVGDVALHHAHG